MLDQERQQQDAATGATAGVPVHFLMFNADARDGVSRAVLTLANELSLTHPVEIISLYRRHDGPAYPISERIRVSYLFDRPPLPRGAAPDLAPWWRPTRHPVRRVLAGRRSRVAHGRGYPNLTMLTDHALRAKLRTITTGVVISTRPALHVAAARFARPGVVTIGQDHLNFRSRANEPGSMEFIEEACRRGLDAFVTLTAGDAEDYARILPPSTRITTIPNALSWPVSPPRELDRRVVVTAGRLVPRKGMARLIRAFAPVARRHPDWELRIYGTGRLEEKLAGQVERMGLTGQVRLLGHTDDLPGAFDEASVFASGSLAEGFPMVMLEALSKGLPLVSFDCPRGPGDIIRNGENGLLIPDGDLPALSAALETLVADEDQRRALGAQARVDAEGYRPAGIAARWAGLFDELGAHASVGS